MPAQKGKQIGDDDDLQHDAAKRHHVRKQRKEDHLNFASICAIWVCLVLGLLMFLVLIGYQLYSGAWDTFQAETMSLGTGIVGYVIAYLKGKKFDSID